MAQIPDGSPDVDSIRNFTVIGHVDHGKTTFVDSLLAANNIISKRSAGKVRYMDSREDEQERGITMESSAISLYFTLQSKISDQPTKTYTLNLIDTPGHVDFSSEVSTASQICDGAVVILDAVEGVCSQTVSVLRQAWSDRIRSVLVINKMDRLITELQLQPQEAYHHLARLVEQVNSIIGSFYQSERMENEYGRKAPPDKHVDNDEVAAKLQEADTSNPNEDDDDDDIYFSPERGNVVFASAIDGWAFRTKDFARIFAVKFGFNPTVLGRFLWGDFYWDAKAKRVVGPKLLKGRNLRPLFVQIALENIWAVYTNVLIEFDSAKVAGIVKSLNLNIPPKQLESKDRRQVLSSILSQWLSLVSTTVQSVIEVLPSPRESQMVRLDQAILQASGLRLAKLEEENQKLATDLATCNAADDSHIIGYISKMFAVSQAHLPARSSDNADGRVRGGSQEDEALLGFARLYSGTLRVGTRVTIVQPKYKNMLTSSDPRNVDEVMTVTVGSLYLMMGRELRPCHEIQAGNIFAISGLEDVVFRSATICAYNTSSVLCAAANGEPHASLLNLGGRSLQVRPFVKFAVEPVDPANVATLARGLQRLSRSDPCVETYQELTGEHVIVTAGELHFERCLKDLKERFARVDVHVSQPIVPFRETIAGKEVSSGRVSRTLENGLHIELSIERLPPGVQAMMQRHSEQIELAPALQTGGTTKASYYRDELGQGLAKSFGNPSNCHLWAVGPGQGGLNVLMDMRDQRLTVPSSFLKNGQDGLSSYSDQFLNDLDVALEAGFQQAVRQGPLCSEPLFGLMVIIHGIGLKSESLSESNVALLHGKLIHSSQAALKDLIEEVLLQLPLRLMLAMYSCEIQASAEVLGKVYAVVSRCHGHVVSEELREGTSYFAVQAKIPAIESFGFAAEIRKKTSGSANPQLVFGGFELLDEDPFWTPTTEEELEDLGEKADRENIAKAYMDKVRERKGLFITRKLVVSAEKQRTMKH